MNSDDMLLKQLEILKGIEQRLDTMIDSMKKELNVDDVVKFYTPSGKKEWVGIPDGWDGLKPFEEIFPDGVLVPPGQHHKARDIWGGVYADNEINDDLIDNLDACFVRNIAKSQARMIGKMDNEMIALQAIIDDMRKQLGYD